MYPHAIHAGTSYVVRRRSSSLVFTKKLIPDPIKIYPVPATSERQDGRANTQRQGTSQE